MKKFIFLIVFLTIIFAIFLFLKPNISNAPTKKLENSGSVESEQVEKSTTPTISIDSISSTKIDLGTNL